MSATVDMSSPFIQQILKTSPHLLDQLGITPAPVAVPVAPVAAPVAPVAPVVAQALTADMVRQIVDERLAATAPPPAAVERLAGVSAQFEALFQKALPEPEYRAFHEYVAGGSPGFAEILASDALHPIAQLLWETIKEKKA